MRLAVDCRKVSSILFSSKDLQLLNSSFEFFRRLPRGTIVPHQTLVTKAGRSIACNNKKVEPRGDVNRPPAVFQQEFDIESLVKQLPC